MPPRSFRFRPRYRGLAAGSIGVGALLIAAGFATAGGAQTAVLVTGGVGVLLGVAYLASPAWRLVVVVDDDALEVTAGGDRRFRLAWADVVEVIASPTTKTCFVDGGAPERSLLVPGVGAPAPYAIEDRAALYDEITARVAADRVRSVELLETRP